MIASASFFSSSRVYLISAPLIVVIIIGDYSDSTLPSITTTSKDYKNIINSFDNTSKHSIVFCENKRASNCSSSFKMVNICGSDSRDCRKKKLKSSVYKTQY